MRILCGFLRWCSVRLNIFSGVTISAKIVQAEPQQHGTKQLGKNSRKRAVGRTVGTGLAGQDSQERTARRNWQDK